MLARTTTTSTFLCNHMFHIPSSRRPQNAQFKQVSSLFSYLPIFSIRPHFFATSLTERSLSPTANIRQTSKTHLDLSPVNLTGIAQLVMAKCSHMFDKSRGKRENFVNGCSLKHLLYDISDIIPGVTRRYWRVLRLKPEDVLEILMGFQFECERVAIKVTKVESLWEIFKWASDQDKSFRHLPKSCEVMASMLMQYGMFREVQLLLLAMERQGISLDNNDIFGSLIEGYVGASDLERAVLVYDQMREQGLVPSLLCYWGLIDLSIRMKRAQLAFRLCLEMMETGINLIDVEKARLENVVGLLCRDGMILEARNLIKKVMALGFKPSSLVLNEIACGHCEKMDFEDSLRFFVETQCSPHVLAGNKIIHSLCRNFGVERANLFQLELEQLGFRPDEITFGILISWCCSEGNLRSAFIYFSEMLSRGLNPDIWSYNALIGAVFKEGMWKHARDILDELVERGITPNLSTFKILLAGYCKARRFDEVRMMVHEMVNHGLIESSSLEDPLLKAFMVLGLDPLSVRLKRDNDMGFSKTEFFDNLGNGLYLDTDLDEYEKRVTGILEDSLIPDFNLLLGKECDCRNFKAAFLLIDEMPRWGQEMSFSVFSALMKGLCTSRSHIKACSSLMEKMPKLANQLDQEVLNLLVRAYCKIGLTYKGWIIFNQMLQRGLTINNGTYTALMMGLCKKGNMRDLHDCWDIAQNGNWLPELESFNSIIECLCHHGMLQEALELFESMLVFYPHSRSEIFHVFLEKLSITGFSSIAQLLVEELLQQGCVLDGIAYSNLIRGLCKERKYAVAFTILDIMLARNMVPCLDVCFILICQLCRAGRLEKAIALTEASSREQSTFSYTVHSLLIKGFCMTGRVREAANLFQEMLLKGFLPDVEIYEMLFQGYCQHKNLRKVRELLGVLIRKCLSLSISSYRNWVRLMCLEGRFIWALSLKDLMLGESIFDSLFIYNILVFYLLSAGQSVLASEILNEIQEKGLLPNEVTYNFLIHGFSRCKDVSSCLHYLSTMISKGLRPSHHSLRTVITCLCDTGELQKVLELSQEMELRGWIHGSIIQNAIVEGLLSHEKHQEAEHFLDRIGDKGLIPDTINYDNLIKRFSYFGRLDKAVDLLDIMLKKANIPISTSYDSVICGFCTCNQLNQAMNFHAEMLDRDLKPSINTWGVLVHKCCQHGQTAEAEKLIISMVQVGETPTRQMYASVIDRYRFESNLRKASEVMEMMQQSGYEPDFDTHWSLISNLSKSNDKENNNSTQGFLSRLLSGSGFSYKKDSNAKL